VDKQTYTNAPTELIGATYGFYTTDKVTVLGVSASQTQYTMTSSHSSGDKTWIIRGPGGSITSVN
jgi:hypothetical protein